MRWKPCLLSLVSVALWVGPLLAADVSVKSLSGPPEEFAAMGLPSSGETAVPTNILMIDELTQSLSGHARVPGTTHSSFNAQPGLGFSLVQVTTQYPTFAPVTFTAPGGGRYVFNGSTITCDFGACDSFQADLQIEPLAPPSTGGVATFSISGGEVTGGSWNLAVQNPAPLPIQSAVSLQVETMIAFDDNLVEVEIDLCRGLGEICPFDVLPGAGHNASFGLVDGAAPVLRLSYSDQEMRSRGQQRGIDLAGLTVTVTDARTRQTFHQERLSAGRLARVPVDRAGSSLVRLPALPAGEYSVRLDIHGYVEGVGPIERTALYFLPILEQRYQATGEVETELVDQERLRLVLDLTPQALDLEHVYAYAEVWTRDGQQPITWIGGMTQPERDRYGRLGLPLMLDTRWLALARTSGSEFLLRNVRIQDADTFIPIEEVAELPFTIRQLPRAASLAAAAVSKDDSLYVGRGDQTIFVDDEPSEPVRGGTTNTGIFLVHGWCSNLVWPVGGHFGLPGRVGGTEIFADTGQSRSHDNFARRIRDQGAARFIDSFTVVAHSQGGAAATHLRAFYNSLLDNSTAPRRIQTMGTPYRGSTLMDFYLATGPLGWLIATILGECTPQFSLGTVGSAFWRVTLPSWARNDVYYYRTGHRRPSNFWQRLQFWRWRCSLTSFVIPGWDDGIVADWQGGLSNAHNMGTTQSECHVNMNHGAQTLNRGRNNIMDREGRPSLVNRARAASTSASSSFTPGCTGGLHCYFPSRVNDGNRSTVLGGFTSWSNNSGQSMPQWVQLHWTSPITFSRVDLYTTASWAIRNFRIEYRSSSTAPWQTLVNVTNNTASVLGPYNVPFPGTVTATDIRVLGFSGPTSQSNHLRVNEIEVY